MSEDVSEARKRITSMRNSLSPFTGGIGMTGKWPPPGSPEAAQWGNLIAALDDMEKRLAELERKAAQ